MIGHIQQRATFNRLSKEGTYVRCGALWCTMLADSGLSEPHVGYAIGRLVGGAVQRNKLRRRLRELMNTEGASLTPGWYLVGASAGARSYDFAQLGANVGCLITEIDARTIPSTSPVVAP